MAQGRINWQNLNAYSVQPSDMELFQAYLNDYDVQVLSGSRSKGVIFGCRLTVVSGLQVQLSAGLVKFPDDRLVVIPQTNITLNSANATNPRIDRIELSYVEVNGTAVVDVNNIAKVLNKVYQPTVSFLAGTPLAVPVAPSQTSINLSMGLVSVSATQTVLVQSNISQDESSNYDSSGIMLGNKNSFIRFNQTLGQLQFSNDGIRYQAFGSGGGGGGGANWQPVSGAAPTPDFEYDERIWKFEQGALQALTLWVKVPSSYLAGSPISLKLNHYSPSSTLNYKFLSTATLVRKGIDAITTSTNQRVSSNSDVVNTLSNQLTEVTYDLSSSLGVVGAQAVSPGDILKVVVQRVAPAGSEDLADLRFIPSSTEISFT